MYNASEGTASASMPPPKNVRAFFHANKGTCSSWLNRIRLAVIVVAMHSGESAIAIRNGQYFLNELMESRNTQARILSKSYRKSGGINSKKNLHF